LEIFKGVRKDAFFVFRRYRPKRPNPPGKTAECAGKSGVPLCFPMISNDFRLELTMPTFVVSLRNCLSHEVRAVNFFMSEGYCVKCKAKKPIADGVEETMKNGRKAIKGKCPTCGTVMFKILGKSATAAPAAPTPTTPPPQA
jgi:Domain of unknown function (DUF5679)